MPAAPIQTLEDWNTRLSRCGCCQMPECPDPIIACESKSITLTPCGNSPPSDYNGIPTDCLVYFQYFRSYVGVTTVTFTSPSGTDHQEITRSYSRDAGGSCQLAETSVHDPAFAGFLYLFVSSTTTWTGGSYDHQENWTNGSVHTTEVWSDPETRATLTASARAVLDAMDFEPFGSCSAAYQYANLLEGCPDADPDSLPSSVSLTAIRYRFQIPATHTGSYFRIEWDEVFYPSTGAPSILAERSVEWTGPGSGDADDPSWFTPWIEVAAPEDPGTIEIRNIAFTCYHGDKFGAKPQFTGETFIPE